MSTFILIEANLAEQRWTAPGEAWRLKMCLAALQANGDAADLKPVRQQFRQRIDTINADRPEPVTLVRLLCLAFDRAVKEHNDLQMMQFGALLAIELKLEPDPEIRGMFQDIKHKAQHGW